LTISNEGGDTLLHTELKHMPLQTQFTYCRGSNSSGLKADAEDNTVSANLNGKSLLLYNIIDDKEDPMELSFAMKENGRDCRYGEIVQHEWLDDGLVLVGFSGGYLLSVSTGSKDLGEEKHCVRVYQSSLTAFSFNPHSKRVASSGDDGVRIIDTKDFSESKQDFISLDDLEDGKVLAVVVYCHSEVALNYYTNSVAGFSTLLVTRWTNSYDRHYKRQCV
jgi:hypothetical protein